jgi:hypothetical protein
MRKRMLILIPLIPWLILLGTAYGSGAETEVLRVTGLVKQPLRLSLADLTRLPLVRLKYNDITREGEFHGVFWFRGVPLRDILELAQMGKEAGGFPKLTDLALVVRSRDGRQVALSWGEVFHRQPAEAVLAVAWKPVMPTKSCKACHSPEEYRPWLAQLERKVVLPKLVLTRDTASDRSLEGVCSLEVVELAPGAWGPKPKRLYSPRVVIQAGASAAPWRNCRRGGGWRWRPTRWAKARASTAGAGMRGCPCANCWPPWRRGTSARSIWSARRTAIARWCPGASCS